MQFHKMTVTYSVACSLVSPPFQTSLPASSSEPFLCEISREREERLHQTRLPQPSLPVHRDTPQVF